MTKNTYLFATLVSLLLAGQTIASEELVRVDKSTFARGEIAWIDDPLIVNASLNISREEALEVQRRGSLGGEPAVSVSARPGAMTASSINELKWPRTDGLPDGWALTLLGDLDFVYPGGRLSWHRDQWLLPPVTGGGLTEKFVYSRSDSGTVYSEALFHGPLVHRWTDLFSNEGKNIRMTLTGKLQMALYCAKETCRLPERAGPFMAQIAINTPLAPKVVMRQSRSWTAKTVRFKHHNSCTLTVDPVRHHVGVLSLTGRQPVPRLLTQDFKSTFSVVCGEDERRRAHVAFGTYWPVPAYATPNGMRSYSIARTSLDGIGIVYSTDKITDCAEAMRFGQLIHVGDGRRGEFVGSTEKDFHFALCTYKSAVEKGNLKGAIFYNYWLD